MILRHALARALIDRGAPRRRGPDFIVGTPERPYLRRWWLLPRNPLLNIYLHQFVGDDDDRALHDHPWVSLSILLRGLLVEHTHEHGEPVARLVVAGQIRARGARFAHRLSLVDARPAWTLFITGPVIREWGFHCPRGWTPWHRFTSPADKGQIGAGCDATPRPPASLWRVLFNRNHA